MHHRSARLITIFLILVFPLLSNAQESGHPGIQSDFVGSTGTVVAYGQKISAPYEVTLVDNVVSINGIHYLPRPEDPDKTSQEVVASSETTRKHDFLQNCAQRYVEYFNTFGEEIAKTKILNTFSSHPSVSKLAFMDDLLVITFPDGMEERIHLNSYISAAPIDRSNDVGVKPEREGSAEQVREYLDLGYLLAFGYDYTILLSDSDTRKLENVVKLLGEGSLTVVEARSKIMSLCGNTLLTEDILRSSGSWTQ